MGQVCSDDRNNEVNIHPTNGLQHEIHTNNSLVMQDRGPPRPRKRLIDEDDDDTESDTDTSQDVFMSYDSQKDVLSGSLQRQISMDRLSNISEAELPTWARKTREGHIWNHQAGWRDYSQTVHSRSIQSFHRAISKWVYILTTKFNRNLDRKAMGRVLAFLSDTSLFSKPYQSQPFNKSDDGIDLKTHNNRIMWHILHSFPFFLDKWDKKRTPARVRFFLADMALLHHCPKCKKHFQEYQRDHPIIEPFTARDMCNWMCCLHNNVNSNGATVKPWFEERRYFQRWKPDDCWMKKRDTLPLPPSTPIGNPFYPMPTIDEMKKTSMKMKGVPSNLFTSKYTKMAHGKVGPRVSMIRTGNDEKALEEGGVLTQSYISGNPSAVRTAPIGSVSMAGGPIVTNGMIRYQESPQMNTGTRLQTSGQPMQGISNFQRMTAGFPSPQSMTHKAVRSDTGFLPQQMIATL